MQLYMKKKSLLYCLSSLLTLLCGTGFSQDFHLSQFDAAPMYLNPALTGIYFRDNADYRIYADYRTQWKSITGKPYSTSFISVDKTFKKFGVGCYFVDNHAGSGGFNTANFLLSGAYQIMDDPNGPHSLTVGVQVGIINKSFDPNNFTFDNQYSTQSPGGFDTGISSNETFDKTSVVNFDANLGVYYKLTDNKKTYHPFAGFSLYHATMPNESFNDTKSRLPMRFALNGGSDFFVNESLDVTASALYMHQAQASELNIGALGFYKIKDTGYQALFGLNYRLKDAIIAQFGLRYGGHTFRISYDVNTSYLSSYSNNRGGIEFSLLLSIEKGNKLIRF